MNLLLQIFKIGAIISKPLFDKEVKMMDRIALEWREQVKIATQIRKETPTPTFTEAEKKILSRVFSNTGKNTYFIYGLPEELVTTLLARYSRIKNPRGLRGLFLEEFVVNIPIIGKIFTDPEGFLKDYGDQECNGEVITGKKIVDVPVEEIEKLIGLGFSLDHYRSVVTVQKIKEFLRKFLDAYGHNSIARMGIVHLAIENISLLAAKTIEWARPGAGYIELSTRFVDMGAKEVYPAWRFFERWYADEIKKHILSRMEAYQRLYPICQLHFETKFAEHDPSKSAITGRVCDSLGNLLPCATLTSLGVSMMGEAYQSIVRHLLADFSPECHVLAKEIVSEAGVVGNLVLLGSHFEPSEKEPIPYRIKVNRLPDWSDKILIPDVLVQKEFLTPNALALESIIKMSGQNIDESFLDAINLFSDLDSRRKAEHESYEKLPDWFEHSSGIFSGLMSFRSWRDLQRMGFCTHKRAWVTPWHGLYLPPDMPQGFVDEYSNAGLRERMLFSSDLTTEMLNFHMLSQYAYMIGNFVPFIVGANLREWEFVNWQRTKWGVNEEVRKVVLKAEQFLRYEYPWWIKISRADTIWEYLFARGDKAIPKT